MQRSSAWTLLLLALKQMCNSGRSTNPRLLHHVRPAQQMEHQPVPRRRGKKVPLPAHTSMYLLQHRTQETPAGACTFLLELKNCWGYPVQQHHFFPALSKAVITPLLGWLFLSPLPYTPWACSDLHCYSSSDLTGRKRAGMALFMEARSNEASLLSSL